MFFDKFMQFWIKIAHSLFLCCSKPLFWLYTSYSSILILQMVALGIDWLVGWLFCALHWILLGSPMKEVTPGWKRNMPRSQQCWPNTWWAFSFCCPAVFLIKFKPLRLMDHCPFENWYEYVTIISSYVKAKPSLSQLEACNWGQPSLANGKLISKIWRLCMVLFWEPHESMLWAIFIQITIHITSTGCKNINENEYIE